MTEEYLALATALQAPASPAYRVQSLAKIFLATSPAEAEAQALPWLAEELPPAAGWEAHTLRVARLEALRPAACVV